MSVLYDDPEFHFGLRKFDWRKTWPDRPRREKAQEIQADYDGHITAQTLESPVEELIQNDHYLEKTIFP